MEDIAYRYLALYRRLPTPVQNAVGRAYSCLPLRLRVGVFYSEYRRRIGRFLGAADAAAVRQMQLALLRETVNAAVRTVPYYREQKEIETFADLEAFPITERSQIVDQPEQFLSTGDIRKRLMANTGGSSGTPMQFLLHAGRTRPKERAHFDWFWGQCGYTPGARVLMIRGASLKGNALYEYQAIKNCLAVSCFELNPGNVGEILRQVRRFRPQFVHGYPSAVRNFISCIEEHDAERWNTPVKAVFLGSEWLPDIDRRQVAAFFDAKVLAWYGHSECAAMGGNSVGSEDLHFYPFYGYAELLDEHNKPVIRAGETGRIVATGFDNHVMPFIRYDTGDLGVLSDRNELHGMPCLVLSRVEGRSQDFIYLSDGAKVSSTAFIFGQHLPQFARIRELQLEQSRAGYLTLRIVKSKEYGAQDTPELLTLLRQSVSGKIEICCEFVDRISKTHRGKHRFLIQRIEGMETR